MVLAVLGILGSLAYTNYSTAYRLRAAGAELKTFLLAARTEAIRRGTGVAVVPGTDFAAFGHVRLSYATSEENLRKALERFARVLGRA